MAVPRLKLGFLFLPIHARLVIDDKGIYDSYKMGKQSGKMSAVCVR